MAKLSPEQLAQVVDWAAEGANLNQIQDRLKKDYDISLTYLDARLLMLDVGVKLKDRPKEPVPAEAAPPPAENASESPDAGQDWDAPPLADDSTLPDETDVGAALAMSADQIAIPGALISGKVTFSDGQTASWFLDQMGRLGLGGTPQGYQPPKADIPTFQQQLDVLLQRAGF